MYFFGSSVFGFWTYSARHVAEYVAKRLLTNSSLYWEWALHWSKNLQLQPHDWIVFDDWHRGGWYKNIFTKIKHLKLNLSDRQSVISQREVHWQCHEGLQIKFDILCVVSNWISDEDPDEISLLRGIIATMFSCSFIFLSNKWLSICYTKLFVISNK